MLDRAACERRVYRLATLLTGNPNGATKVIEAVVGARGDLRTLDSAHLDRLTVLRSRELVTVSDAVAAGSMADAAAIGHALTRLPAQQREAWVFRRVYQVDPRETARSMDCSVTASDRHLALADEAMTSALGDDATGAAARLLEYSMSLEVPAFYRARLRRRWRLRVALRIIQIVVGLAVAGVAVAWLTNVLLRELG